MASHGVGYADVYKSIWLIVDAINLYPKFRIQFPTSYVDQKQIDWDLITVSVMSMDY